MQSNTARKKGACAYTLNDLQVWASAFLRLQEAYDLIHHLLVNNFGNISP